MRRVRARAGETLCSIAIREGGFLDCRPLRDHPDNARLRGPSLEVGALVTVPELREARRSAATERRHRFTRKATPGYDLRFVHGSPNLPYRKDASLDALAVSNHPSDKGSRYPTDGGGARSYGALPPLPSRYGYDDDGHEDEDTFKIEVVDPSAEGDVLRVELGARKPVYVDGKVDHHTDFSAGDPDAGARSVVVECERVSSGLRVFRSRYMRLVTNVQDFNALQAKGQALLVAPMADGSGGAADEVEVLDQRVRARYALPGCKASRGEPCELVCELPVGRPGAGRRVRAAAHILRSGRGGSGVLTESQARKGLLNFVREIYAQAELSLVLVEPRIRLVEPPANLIAVSNEHGRRAAGGTISIRVRIDAGDETVSVTTSRGDPPRRTADRLAEEIRKACGVDVRVQTNPPCVGRARGSADVLVGDPQAQRVRLSVVRADDARQTVDIARIVGTTIDEFAGHDAHVGTLDERVLVKNYDGGSDRIDTFLVGGLDQGSYGEAFSPCRRSPADERPSAEMVNSVLVDASTQTSLTNAHTTIPHEWAHVLMDANHIPKPTTELVTSGSPVGANEQVVNAPRRIGDPPRGAAFRVAWDDGARGSPVRRLRGRNRRLLDGW